MRVWLAVIAWGLWAALGGRPAQAPPAFDGLRVTLVAAGTDFGLHDARAPGRFPVPVSREWLIPPGEEEESEHDYLSAFNYSERTNAFDLGDGRLGVHCSSYDVMTSGSAGYAGGRDKFLIYEPRTRRATPGGLAAGITKERIRLGDCLWPARHTRFFVGDVNGDGLTDVGVQVEGLECPTRPDDGQARNVDDELDDVTRFRLEPLRWHLLRGDRWIHDQAFDGARSGAATELPLIDLVMSPVEYSRRILRDMRARQTAVPRKP